MSSRVHKAWIAALGLLLIGSCRPEPPPDETSELPRKEMSEPPPEETPAPPPEGAAGPPDLPDLFFLALGTEPFWNVRVFANRLRYEALGEEPVVFDSPRHVAEPGSRKRTWTAETGAREISLTIEQRPCSDTMSDVSYRYAATVRLGERSLAGCAMKGGAAETD